MWLVGQVTQDPVLGLKSEGGAQVQMFDELV